MLLGTGISIISPLSDFLHAIAIYFFHYNFALSIFTCFWAPGFPSRFRTFNFYMLLGTGISIISSLSDFLHAIVIYFFHHNFTLSIFTCFWEPEVPSFLHRFISYMQLTPIFSITISHFPFLHAFLSRDFHHFSII